LWLWCGETPKSIALLSVNCQVALVFVKMGCQKIGDDKFVAAQMVVVALGRTSPFIVTLPLALRMIVQVWPSGDGVVRWIPNRAGGQSGWRHSRHECFRDGIATHALLDRRGQRNGRDKSPILRNASWQRQGIGRERRRVV
jgi:hypothetical protein